MNTHCSIPGSPLVSRISSTRFAMAAFRQLSSWVLLGLWFLGVTTLQAQVDGSVSTNAAISVPTGVTFSINGIPKPQDVDVTIQIVGALTLLSLAPSLPSS